MNEQEATIEELKKSLKYAEERLRSAEWEYNHWQNIVNGIKLDIEHPHSGGQ